MVAEINHGVGGDKVEHCRFQDHDPGADPMAENLVRGGFLQDPLDAAPPIGGYDAARCWILTIVEGQGKQSLVFTVKLEQAMHIAMAEIVTIP